MCFPRERTQVAEEEILDLDGHVGDADMELLVGRQLDRSDSEVLQSGAEVRIESVEVLEENLRERLRVRLHVREADHQRVALSTLQTLHRLRVLAHSSHFEAAHREWEGMNDFRWR